MAFQKATPLREHHKRSIFPMNEMNEVNTINYVAKRAIDTVQTRWREQIYDALAIGVLHVYDMGVEGDIAEFGTMTGRTAVALSSAFAVLDNKRGADTRISEGIRNKKIWFFDSFEGLPEARFDVDKNSDHVLNGFWASGTCKGLTYEQFVQLIGKLIAPDSFRVVKGFFKDTIPTVPDSNKFSLLHIDGDLYESAIDVLDSLFKRKMVSPGALIFFDDWNCNHADPNLGERRAWKEVEQRYNIQSSDEGPYAISGHKFIVHSYDSA